MLTPKAVTETTPVVVERNVSRSRRHARGAARRRASVAPRGTSAVKGSGGGLRLAGQALA